MSFVVMTYADRHFEGVDALWREAFPHDAPRNHAIAAIPQKLLTQPELFLVAVEQDRVAGSVMAGYDGYRGWLNRLAVLKSHQGRGIGAALIRETESRLHARGCSKINLQILSSNEAVMGFYRRLGYEIEERISMSKPAPFGQPLDLKKPS
jgi:ribosomal protein S18 acetylase RimI-like enzyme